MARILLIDDADGILAATGAMLRLLGYEVVTAQSGEEGLAQYEKAQFDLVITDLRMPGLDGHEVIAAIRRINPEARIVASEGSISANPMGTDGVVRHLDVDGRLQKPYNVASLKAVIAKAMGTPGEA